MRRQGNPLQCSCLENPRDGGAWWAAVSGVINNTIINNTLETVSDFILGGSKITADGDCSHEMKRCLLLGRKVMTNLDSIFKSSTRGERSPKGISEGPGHRKLERRGIPAPKPLTVWIKIDCGKFFKRWEYQTT